MFILRAMTPRNVPAAIPERAVSPLEQARRERGLSQARLAEAADLSVRTMWRLERRGDQPTRRTARKLAAALGVAPEDLFEFKEPHQP